MPKALNSEARRQLREMSYAPTRVECERLRDEYVSDLRADGRSDAAISTTAMIPYGPSGTGSDPFHNWLRCLPNDLSIRSRRCFGTGSRSLASTTYPVEHWVHLRTTNPLESVFSAVRLRTNATRRMKRRDSALYLVFKVSLRLSERWRPLNGGRNLIQATAPGLLVDGAKFEDGILAELPVSVEEAVAA